MVEPGLDARIAIERYRPYGRGRLRLLRSVEARRLLRESFARIRPDLLHAHDLTRYGRLARLSGFHPYAIPLTGRARVAPLRPGRPTARPLRGAREASRKHRAAGAGQYLRRRSLATPSISPAVAASQRSIRTCSIRSRRPTAVRLAVRWSMRALYRLGASRSPNRGRGHSICHQGERERYPRRGTADDSEVKRCTDQGEPPKAMSLASAICTGDRTGDDAQGHPGGRAPHGA